MQLSLSSSGGLTCDLDWPGNISEVRYLHKNPGIEATLLRKGIYRIIEDEMIQVNDTSLSNTGSSTGPGVYDSLADAHVFTGLEPLAFKKLRNKGFQGNNYTLQDPRAAVLANSIDGGSGEVLSASGNGLPPEIETSIEGGVPLSDVVLAHIRREYGNLVLILFDQVAMDKPPAAYGMDSMLAAEFRAWFSFHVDIPFLWLLSNTSTLQTLGESVLSNHSKERSS